MLGGCATRVVEARSGSLPCCCSAKKGSAAPGEVRDTGDAELDGVGLAEVGVAASGLRGARRRDRQGARRSSCSASRRVPGVEGEGARRLGRGEVEGADASGLDVALGEAVDGEVLGARVHSTSPCHRGRGSEASMAWSRACRGWSCCGDSDAGTGERARWPGMEQGEAAA